MEITKGSQNKYLKRQYFLWFLPISNNKEHRKIFERWSGRNQSYYNPNEMILFYNVIHLQYNIFHTDFKFVGNVE